MNRYSFASAVLTASIVYSFALCGCGGSESKTSQFNNLVSFGDSLSDVGSYAVGEVATLGGGKFTINGVSNKIWVEDVASAIGVSAPCAAQTGLNGLADDGFSVATVNHPKCYDYSQGGSRVTDPVGLGNEAQGGSSAILGELTLPVITQIQNHLSLHGGSFTGRELVTVFAGDNDVLYALEALSAGQESSADAMNAVTTAGTQLAECIVNNVLNKGANHVLVLNLQDASLAPFALAEPASTQAFIRQLTVSYNTALQTGLASTSASKVLQVDVFSFSEAEAANPSKYGFTNITDPACNLSSSVNPLGSSLTCTTANLEPGSVLNYQFADTGHPTPFSHSVLAQEVLAQMAAAGWYQAN